MNDYCLHDMIRSDCGYCTPRIPVPIQYDYSRKSSTCHEGSYDMHQPGPHSGQLWTDSENKQLDIQLGQPPLSMEGLAHVAEALGRSMEAIRDHYERRHPEYYSNSRDET